MPHIKGTKWKFEDIFSKIYIVNSDVDHQKISENTLEWICPLTVKGCSFSLTKTYSRGQEFITLPIEFTTYVNFTLSSQQNFIIKSY